MKGSRSAAYLGSANLFKLVVVVPVLAAMGANAAVNPRSVLHLPLAFWALAVAAAELLPVPTRGGAQLSLSFPILLAVVMLYDPAPAAVVAFFGAFDRRELRLRISLLDALFNRCQLALSVLVGSAVFHALANFHAQGQHVSPWYWLIPAVIVTKVADYLVNVTLVATVLKLAAPMPFRQAVGQLKVGALPEFLVNYLGLSLIGVIIAQLSRTSAGEWAVAAFIAPLVFARQMFLRTIALEEATKELQDREQVLRALSNRMAEERQDERLHIAAYLHDDLAQTLFQLTLRLEMAKKRLSQGDLPGVERDLDQISSIKQRTSDMVRSLVKDLHHAPIGRAGLHDALGSIATEMGRPAGVEIEVDVVQVPLPPPIQLLIYQIAREAVMNALKHAQPKRVWISMKETGDGVDLIVRDNGRGFDTSTPQPEGHFGSVMMRERAMVAGGSFGVQSEPGRGTTIIAHFPAVWVEEATREGGLLAEEAEVERQSPGGGEAERSANGPDAGSSRVIPA